jgi:hypothetical protein
MFFRKEMSNKVAFKITNNSSEKIKMDIERVRHIFNSLMIISFFIFGGLAGILLIIDAPLNGRTVSLPFSFLFISIMTLILTTQIKDNPNRIDLYIREWLATCIFVIIIGALTFTFSG